MSICGELDSVDVFDSFGLESPPTSGSKSSSNKSLASLVNRLIEGSLLSTDSESSLLRVISPLSDFEDEGGVARRIIDVTGSLLMESELEEIVDFIDKNRSKYSNKDVYLPSSKTKLSRTLKFCEDGSLYIHFNKKLEDVIVGRGLSKVAKFTFDYDAKKLCVRTTELGFRRKEIDFFNRVKDIPGAAKLLHSRVFTSKKINRMDECLVKTEIIMPYYENGTLADIDNRLNGTEFSAKEKGAIKTNIARKIRETISEFHKRGLHHGDLHEGNIFLDKDFEPVLADFGCSGIATSASQKRNDMLYLNRICSSMLEE